MCVSCVAVITYFVDTPLYHMSRALSSARRENTRGVSVYFGVPWMFGGDVAQIKTTD